jgi:hypothetical protein
MYCVPTETTKYASQTAEGSTLTSSTNGKKLYALVRVLHSTIFAGITCIIVNPLHISSSSSKQGEPCSSVSIVSGYELDDRLIEIRSPAVAKGFFL